MRVLIRADASLAIGSGHVVRCLTLANALRDQGAVVSFASRELPGNALARIADAGFAVLVLPASYPGDRAGNIESLIDWQADLAALQTQLAGQPPFDWLLVDHYGLDAQWQRSARAFAQRIAVIDDLANRPHDADLLIDQNLTATADAYAPLIPASCQTLLGPRYALLRPEFRVPAPTIRAKADRVVVNFGGVDAGGETFKAMEALAGLPIHADIVAGSANPAWDALQAKAQGQANWTLHRHVADFAALMQQADVFIGAGGTTSWERAALGVPTLCIAVADNQEPNAQALHAAGIHQYLGRDRHVTASQLGKAISDLLADAPRRQSYADKSRALVDAKGTQRVAAAMLHACLTLRPATLDDAQRLFDGRNAENVRRWSINSEPISWDAHIDWLTRTLANPDRQLWIAESANGPVGVLRYDRNADLPDRAEVSIYLFAGREGVGWGGALLQAGDAAIARLWPALRAIDATVLPDNTASLKLFVQAGYREHNGHFERVLPQ
ncbi:UDP-2,4-diacetamido-2,4,6-trideoxy-beta-L-altropyranose hydrolase [Chitinimonas sp. BJYL2]|uniref:UDP-2,4-diacetamido-2,4, 6-trideoxy-beta-L-altropyranose hydrolase n=1 Tax=Chitinimonas sp. BJYL2 TaxID=2976696 RepID=UPI0022B3B47D|nr:UDP-2,4-diacetamido-2,4,6-trideoxy-beta-L-altropyranose hydrolase [Chitinimonas sp. BJYL2]